VSPFFDKEKVYINKSDNEGWLQSWHHTNDYIQTEIHTIHTLNNIKRRRANLLTIPNKESLEEIIL